MEAEELEIERPVRTPDRLIDVEHPAEGGIERFRHARPRIDRAKAERAHIVDEPPYPFVRHGGQLRKGRLNEAEFARAGRPQDQRRGQPPVLAELCDQRTHVGLAHPRNGVRRRPFARLLFQRRGHAMIDLVPLHEIFAKLFRNHRDQPLHQQGGQFAALHQRHGNIRIVRIAFDEYGCRRLVDDGARIVNEPQHGAAVPAMGDRLGNRRGDIRPSGDGALFGRRAVIDEPDQILVRQHGRALENRYRHLVDIPRELEHDIARRARIVVDASRQRLAHGDRDVMDEEAENLMGEFAFARRQFHIRELPRNLHGNGRARVLGRIRKEPLDIRYAQLSRVHDGLGLSESAPDCGAQPDRP